MTQFIQLDKAILKNKKLNSNEKIALSLITDRMKSSVKRDNFFDKKQNDFYVIYTIEEMMTDLGLSKGTTVNIFKKLEKLGYITKSKCFNGATKIFTPNENAPVSSKSEPSKVQNLDSNHTNLNHINNTYDTNDTEISVNKTNSRHTKQIKQDELEILSQSLIKNAGVPASLVEILQVYSFGDVKKLYNYAGMIFKAKNFAKKQAEKTLGSMYTTFRFETNQFISDALVMNIKAIVINANKKAHNANGYIMRALINLFEEQANLYLVQQR